MNYRQIAFIFILGIYHHFALSYINSAIGLELIGDRKIVVVFDAYEGYSSDLNKSHAFALTLSAIKVAKSFPSQQIEFSFEDPAVYDVDSLLKSRLPLVAQNIIHARDNHYLSCLNTYNKDHIFDLMLFAKPDNLTTYLAGDLIKIFAQVTEWPTNLILRSNDPRQEHYLALFKSKQWLLNNQNNIRTKNLITASPLLATKRILFKPDPLLSEEQNKKLNAFFDQFQNTEQAQVQAFANFLSLKNKHDIKKEELNETLIKLTNYAPLDHLYDFTNSIKQRTDIYSDGPIMDVLLSLFGKQHPDIMVIALGNHLAKQLVQFLHEMDVVTTVHNINDAIGYFTTLSLRPLQTLDFPWLQE